MSRHEGDPRHPGWCSETHPYPLVQLCPPHASSYIRVRSNRLTYSSHTLFMPLAPFDIRPSQVVTRLTQRGRDQSGANDKSSTCTI